MLHIVVILFLSLFCFSEDGTFLTKAPLRLDLTKDFCKGEFEPVSKEAASVTPASPSYLVSQFAALSSNERLNAVLSEFEKERSAFRNIRHDKRLIYVGALMRSHSEDLKIQEDLLNFTSKDPIISGYQKVLTGDLIIVDYPELALKNYIDGFRELPYLDSALLSKIFQMAMQDKNASLILNPFLPYIEQLPDESEDKYILMAYREFLNSKLENKEVAYSYVKKAYELCPYDQDIALFHASNLIYEKNFEEAKKVLLKLETKIPAHSPYVDLFLAKVFIAENNKVEATKYVQIGLTKKTSLVPSAIAELEGMNVEEKESRKPEVYLLVLAAASLLALVVMIRKRSRTKKTKVFCYIVFLLIIAIAAFWVKDWLTIDRCLDSGGRWNYDSKICEQ